MIKSRIIGRLLFQIAAIIGALPMPVLRLIGSSFGQIWYWLGSRETRVTRRNMQLIAPSDTAEQTEAKVEKLLSSTGQTVFETLAAWTRPRQHALKLIKNVYGIEHLHNAKAQGKGVLLATPHYGNWELLLHFMAEQGPLSVVYNPPDSAALDHFLYLARDADSVHMVPAEATAMRPLLRALQKGETVGITPDQQPKKGGGEFAPFFGIQALTLSLSAKLAHRSGAPVIFSYCERNGNGFDVYIEAAEPAMQSADLQTALTAMNRRVQAIAERDFSQYQWTYKRFSIRPSPDEKNPYK